MMLQQTLLFLRVVNGGRYYQLKTFHKNWMSTMGKITNKSDNFYWWIAIVSCQDKNIRLHRCYLVKIRIFKEWKVSKIPALWRQKWDWTHFFITCTVDTDRTSNTGPVTTKFCNFFQQLYSCPISIKILKASHPRVNAS